MENTIDINPNSVILDIQSDNQNGALKELLDRFYEQRFVEHEYIQQVLEREMFFPTGLVFKDITIALPHGDNVGINKSAIGIGRCHKKIEFAMMDDKTKKVTVDVIILLAIQDPNGHMSILANLIQSLQEKELCDVLKFETSKNKLCETLNKIINKEN